MPNLNDISYYETLSQAYTDQTQTYADGTTNPNYGQGAYVQVWNSTTSKYVTVSTNGVVTGSTALIGSSAHPIIIHGPVTVTQDTVITGTVSGSRNGLLRPKMFTSWVPLYTAIRPISKEVT